MFKTFLFKGYLKKKTLNYLKRMILFYLTHMMNMADFITIRVYTSIIDSGYYLEKRDHIIYLYHSCVDRLIYFEYNL